MSKYPKPRKWVPKNKEKYKGNWDNIISRSSWELRFFKWVDDNPNIIEWSSEEIIIPYKSPVDNQFHRYYPDIWARMADKSGRTKTYLIEIKPFSQSIAPQVKKRITKQYINEVCVYGVNMSKWKAAKIYCADRGWEFKVITERDLF